MLTLTPKQVATALGLNQSTIKRWCDLGRLKSIRTVGGHRRLPMREVFAFLRENGSELCQPTIFGLPPVEGAAPLLSLSQAKDRFREALVSGDEPKARDVLIRLFLRQTRLSAIADEVIAPAMHDIGELWDCGRVEVYQERRSCELALNALREIRQYLPLPAAEAPLAIGGTLEGDHYSLGSALVELTLRESGWNSRSLGIGSPFDRFHAAIDAEKPRLVWVSASHIPDDHRFLSGMDRLFDHASSQGAALAVGGRALTATLRRQMRYTSFSDTLQQFAQFARVLFPQEISDTGTSFGSS